MQKPIRVMIVDDSAVVRQTLKEVLESDQQIEVVSVASRPFHLSLARADLQNTLCYPNPPRLAWPTPDQLQTGKKATEGPGLSAEPEPQVIGEIGKAEAQNDDGREIAEEAGRMGHRRAPVRLWTWSAEHGEIGKRWEVF